MIGLKHSFIHAAVAATVSKSLATLRPEYQVSGRFSNQILNFINSILTLSPHPHIYREN
jgi:hypothetical protein